MGGIGGDTEMKEVTIVIKIPEGSEFKPVTFGDEVCGGEVTGLAAYNLMETMEIAEEALETHDNEFCMDAMHEINKVIKRNME